MYWGYLVLPLHRSVYDIVFCGQTLFQEHVESSIVFPHGTLENIRVKYLLVITIGLKEGTRLGIDKDKSSRLVDSPIICIK